MDAWKHRPMVFKEIIFSFQHNHCKDGENTINIYLWPDPQT
jgi:hypothetical protein